MSGNSAYRRLFVIIQLAVLFAVRFAAQYLLSAAVPEKTTAIVNQILFCIIYLLSWLVPFGIYFFLSCPKHLCFSVPSEQKCPIVPLYFAAYFVASCADILSDFIFTCVGISDSASVIPSEGITVWILFSVFVVPVVEEFVFRCVVFNSLAVFETKIAVVFSAILFAVCHDIGSMAYAFVFGIIFAIIAAHKSIWFSILFHVLNNSISCILLLLSRMCTDSIYSYISVGTFLVLSFVGMGSIVYLVLFKKKVRNCK